VCVCVASYERRLRGKAGEVSSTLFLDNNNELPPFPVRYLNIDPSLTLWFLFFFLLLLLLRLLRNTPEGLLPTGKI